MEMSELPVMLASIGLVGVLLLFVLAVMISIVEKRSRHQAWDRIATARRIAAEREAALDARTLELEALDRRLHQRVASDDAPVDPR